MPMLPDQDTLTTGIEPSGDGLPVAVLRPLVIRGNPLAVRLRFR